MQLTKTGDTIFKFRSLALANAFTEHTYKMWMVILGDDEMFWVVTPGHAGRLLRQGYELAE